MTPIAPQTLARLNGLLEVSRLVRGATDVSAVLDAVARVVGESFGFGIAVVNVHRPAWDDFEAAAVHGSETAREAILGQTLPREYWAPLLDPRFDREGVQLVPHEERDWDADGGIWFVPSGEPGERADGWDPADALLVPLRHSDGTLLGILSLNEPDSGLRPSDEELAVLVAVAGYAGRAIEAAEEAAAAARHRSALEQLLHVSSELARADSPARVLQLVCHGIRDALGFGLAVVQLADRDADRYRAAASAGVEVTDRRIEIAGSATRFDAVFDERHEVEGCYLLTRDEAHGLVGGGTTRFEATLNGRGPLAWDRHWLLLPLHDRSGARIGFIWADDPEDRLLPSRDRLQALRLFADQAAQALVAAEQHEALRSAHARQAALFDSSPLAIVAVGPDNRVTAWNPAAEELFGWTVDEVLGRPLPYVEESDAPGLGDMLGRLLRGGDPVVYEAARRRRDGRTVEISVSAAPMRSPEGEPIGVMSMSLDVTGRKRTEADLARRHAELEALHATTLELLEELDTQALLETIVSRACDLLGTPHGSLYLVGEAGLEMRVGVGAFTQLVGTTVALGEGLSGLAAVSGEAQTVRDYSAWDQRLPEYEEAGFRAVCCVPLWSGRDVVGVFSVASVDEKHAFGDSDQALLDRFAQLASLALANARLYEAARTSERRYRRLVETSRDAITVVTTDGRVAFASPSHEDMIGYRPEELVGRSLAEFIHPDDLPTVEGRIASIAGGGPPVPTVVRVRHRDGGWVVLESIPTPVHGERGRVEQILAVSRDVTEREARERELRESRELYRTVVETATDLIALYDLDGRIVYASPSHRDVLAKEPEALVGAHVLDNVHPDDHEEAERALAECVAHGESAWTLRIAPAAGEWLVVEGTWRAVPGADGEPRLMLCTGRDVTERRRAEEERVALEDQLRQAQKMEAVGRLAGGIAHDFNNLLTAFAGYGDFALAQLPPDSPVRRHVHEMLRAGERAADLTRQLLAFSRKQVLQPQVLDLNGVVADMEGMLGRLLGEDVELVTVLDPALGRTRADRGQIEQVVMNLAVNARDAMPRGGRLRITTANAGADRISLTVADSGDGMDAETLARVFEPFFTTKPPGKGTGLGLSTVYGIVSQTGGVVEAASEPAAGTTFRVLLPRVADEVEPHGCEPDAPARRGGMGTVLLVEDEEIVRGLVKALLEDGGYTVVAAADGEEALALAEAHDGPIDALVTDVVMPGLSGPEVAGRLAASRPGLPVVFTSGYAQDAMGEDVLRGGTTFLAKPFTAAQLDAKLSEVLRAR